LFQPEVTAPRCAEPQRRVREPQQGFEPVGQTISSTPARTSKAPRPWPRIEQALRTTDLLLQAGGFSAIVLDMASLAPEFALRVPLATWFRYRAGAERTQSSILLLTQHSCAKSSAELLLRLQPGQPLCHETTVFSGLGSTLDVERQRFAKPSNVIPMKKPPQQASSTQWHSRAAEAGRR
jgi:hypothetical protein